MRSKIKTTEETAMGAVNDISLKEDESFTSENASETTKNQIKYNADSTDETIRVSRKHKHPYKIRKLCGTGQISKTRLSPLPLEYIDCNEEDNSVLTAKMAESIKENGQITPVLVYKAKQNSFKIIDGKRRVLAARMLNKNYIDCLILSCGEETGEIISKANSINKISLDIHDTLENIKKENLSSEELIKIFSLHPDIELKNASEIITNISFIDRSEICSLKKIGLTDVLADIINTKDKDVRHAKENSAADLLEDYRSVIKKVEQEYITKLRRSERIVIKDAIFLFNSFDSIVKRLTEDSKNNIVNITKEVNSNFSEYILHIEPSAQTSEIKQLVLWDQIT